MVELFPSKLIHMAVTRGSQYLDGLAAGEEVDGTGRHRGHLRPAEPFHEAYQEDASERGRTVGGWMKSAMAAGSIRWYTSDGMAEAGGWRRTARQGYDVVMTPGQAYYLDMVQDEAFQEPGASWAGTVPPKHTYTYEAVGEFPDELKPAHARRAGLHLVGAFPEPGLLQPFGLPPSRGDC